MLKNVKLCNKYIINIYKTVNFLNIYVFIYVREEKMSYTLNSFVNKNEADALKEMIFRRVRERSQSMNEDVQSDVMDLARDSFVSKDNPFSKIVKNNAAIEENKIEDNAEKQKEIGFPVRKLNSHAQEQTKTLTEKICASAIQNNMEEARAGLSTKTSFMGALNFLNSQAAVSLMRTKSDKFEVVA